MRIAYCIINHNKREGTSKAVAEVAERLAEKHEVHIFSRSAEGVDLRRIRRHQVGMFRYPHVAEFLGYVWPCSWKLKAGQFDIVHAAGAVFAAADVYTIQNIQPAKRHVLAQLKGAEKVGPARRLTRAAYLEVTSRWERHCYERTLPNKPTLLPVSRGVEQELRQFYQVEKNPIQVIPNAADTARFKSLPEEDRRTVRASFSISPSDFVCVFSGGEWRRKGLDLAIKAVGLMRNPAVKLLVLGRDDSEEEFRSLARDVGVEDRVIFAGFQVNVERALAGADVFIFPSRYEAFSLAMLEAAACGLPLLATRINGAAEIVEPGVTGELVNHCAEEIAEVLSAWVRKPPEELEAMGAAARRRVERDYTWDRVAAMTEAVYQQLVDGRRR